MDAPRQQEGEDAGADGRSERPAVVPLHPVRRRRQGVAGEVEDTYIGIELGPQLLDDAGEAARPRRAHQCANWIAVAHRMPMTRVAVAPRPVSPVSVCTGRVDAICRCSRTDILDPIRPAFC